MYKISYILLLCCIFGLGATAQARQSYKLDSLKALLPGKMGSEKADVLIDLSEAYWQIDSTQAILYARQAYKEAEPVGYLKGMVWGIAYEGIAHEYFGEPEIALSFYKKALAFSYKQNYAEGISESLGNIAIAYQSMNQPDSAFHYYRVSLALARKLKNSKMISDQLTNLGNIHETLAQYDSAQYYLNEAIVVMREDQDSVAMLEAYKQLGSINRQMGNMSAAFRYYSTMLQMALRSRNEHEMAIAYDYVGSIYAQQDQFDEALAHYQKSLAIREKIGEKVNLSVSLANIGQIYSYMQRYEEALEHFQRALFLDRNMKNKPREASILNSIGNVYRKQGKLKEGIAEQLNALVIFKELNDVYDIGTSCLSISYGYERLGDKASAIKYAKEAFDIGKKIGAKSMIKNAARQLAIMYNGTQNYKEAATYYQEALVMTDSLYTEDQHKALAEMEAKYRNKQQAEHMLVLQKEQELNANRIKNQNMLFVALAFILVLAIAFLVVLYRSDQHKKLVNQELASQKTEIQQRNEEILIQQEAIEKQNQMLATRNDELKELDKEKNYLIGVVAHDLKSPINQVRGLIEIIKFDIDKLPEETVKLLIMIEQILQNTSDMIAKILDLKAIEAKSLNLNMRVYNLSQQIQHIAEAFQGVAKRKHINLIYESNPENLEWRLDYNLVEQIVENLVSNSIKFSPVKKEMRLSIIQKSNNVQIRIADQGPGIHPDEQHKLFQKYQRLSSKPTGDESSTGLGLSIVKKYVEGMGGKVWCESEWGKGATFIVDFPRETTTATVIEGEDA